MAEKSTRKATGHGGARHPAGRGPAPGRDVVVAAARRVTFATDCPVVGGVAVILHGGGRSTYDIDIYSEDFWATHEKLEAAGFMWDGAKHEHVVGDLGVHMVGPDLLGGPPKRLSTIDGVKVIGLADLIRGKLSGGLETVRRSKDIAHVIDLIERIPFDTSFAAKLPTKLRAPFKRLVDEVHGPRRTTLPPAVFRKKYA